MREIMKLLKYFIYMDCKIFTWQKFRRYFIECHLNNNGKGLAKKGRFVPIFGQLCWINDKPALNQTLKISEGQFGLNRFVSSSFVRKPLDL